MSFSSANPTHANTGALSNTTALTIPASTIGRLGFLGFSNDHTKPILTVTNGGTWAKIGSTQVDATNSQDMSLWWTIYSSSVTTLNFTACAAAAFVYLEFSSTLGWPVSPLDVQDTTTSTFGPSSTTPNALATGNITPAAANELIVSLGTSSNGTAPVWTQGTGYTMGVQEPGAAGNDGSAVLQWKIGASGAQNATLSINTASERWAIMVAAFKENAPAGNTYTKTGMAIA